MNEQNALADGVELCQSLMTRFFGGFGDQNRTVQGMDLPNHLAWVLGHCALTMRRAAQLIDGEEIPESDFISGAREGDPDRFGAESVAFGSTPVDDPGIYPTISRGKEIYSAACDRLAESVRTTTSEKLDEIIAWGGGEMTIRALVARMIFHNGVHCGQITDLRRALRLPSIFSQTPLHNKKKAT